MIFEVGKFYTRFTNDNEAIEVTKVISKSKLRGRYWATPFQMYPFLKYLEEKVFLITPENWREVDFDEMEFYKWKA